jgi:hypothetical protein
VRTDSSMSPIPFAGRLSARLPVVRGPRPHDSLTLADLGDPTTLTGLTSGLPDSSSRRATALHPLHLALAAVTTGILAPLAHDRTELVVAPTQLGVSLSDDAEITAVWVGSAAPLPPPADARRAGAHVRQLLAPVAAESRRRGRIGAGAMEVLLLDSLSAQGVRLQRQRLGAGDVFWLAAFLDGTAWRAPSAAPTVVVHPDLGPAVELSMRRACCIQATRPTAGCCPTCPLVRDPGVREQRVVEWLHDVDDVDFFSITGRPRLRLRPAHTA